MVFILICRKKIRRNYTYNSAILSVMLALIPDNLALSDLQETTCRFSLETFWSKFSTKIAQALIFSLKVKNTLLVKR